MRSSNPVLSRLTPETQTGSRPPVGYGQQALIDVPAAAISSYSNTYAGPWRFVVHGQGTSVNWSTWQGAPYSQDRDSVVKIITPGGR